MNEEWERDEEERPPEPRVCPACESPKIRRTKRALGFAVAAAIAAASGFAFDQSQAAFLFIAAAAIFAIVTDRWVCEECGETWK